MCLPEKNLIGPIITYTYEGLKPRPGRKQPADDLPTYESGENPMPEPKPGDSTLSHAHENRLRSYSSGGVVMTYVYEADGKYRLK
jgi:hypothetical protein